jgi:hypothetical protein
MPAAIASQVASRCWPVRTSRMADQMQSVQQVATSAGGIDTRLRKICQGESAATSAAQGAAAGIRSSRTRPYTHGTASAPNTATITRAASGCGPTSAIHGNSRYVSSGEIQSP